MVARAVIGLALLVLGAHVSGAEREDKPLQLSEGARVRISAPVVAARPILGTVVGLDERTVDVAVIGKGDAVVVPRSAISRIDVGCGRRSRGRNALIGAGIGLGMGALLGLAHGGDDPEMWIAYSAGEYALMFAALGAPAGALVGAAVPPRERWRELPLPAVQLTRGRRRSIAVAITLPLSF